MYYMVGAWLYLCAHGCISMRPQRCGKERTASQAASSGRVPISWATAPVAGLVTLAIDSSCSRVGQAKAST